LSGEQAAAIIEQIEHGEGDPGVRKPPVRRGVELPEFADLSALQRRTAARIFLRDGMGELVFERPAADLGAVEFEGVQAEGLGSRKAIRTGRRAGQAFLEQVQDGLWPDGGMIATGSAGRPEPLWLADARGVVSGGQRVKAAGRDGRVARRLGRH